MVKYIRNQNGNLAIIGAFLMVVLVLGLAFIYLGNSKKSVDNGFALKTDYAKPTFVPKPEPPQSPSPFSTTLPDYLPPLPELAKTNQFSEQQFLDEDFPFSFYYPNYFVTEKLDFTLEKAAFIEKNPGKKWNLLSAVKLGVPDDKSLFSYKNCANFMNIFFRKYDNPDKQSLADFIKTGRSTIANYEQSSSKVSYPRPNSSLFVGKINENEVKELFFEYDDAYYSASLVGGCNPGERYSTEADTMYTNIMQSLTFK